MATSDSRGGFCSASCLTEECMDEEIRKPTIRTSDVYKTCNLPKRFNNPDWFNGYGCQSNVQHPLYRTTSNDYGWYAPGIHNVPTVFYPMPQKFTNNLAKAGMYRNYSLNTGMDKVNI